ncbi:hypothetical protein [Microcoleus sp. OTE_8_concoct_300]|uniref:hypothetical protein n=1 Tax=Microcoleus sp. OTE_8_concoct_300 TaxID=2964710 RepID=UPI00403F2F11
MEKFYQASFAAVVRTRFADFNNNFSATEIVEPGTVKEAEAIARAHPNISMLVVYFPVS